jgi:hypothetical protein
VEAERQVLIAQELIYEHVKHVSYDALDQAAAVDIIMQTYAKKVGGPAPDGGLNASTTGAAASAGKRGGNKQLVHLSKRGRKAFHQVLQQDFEALLGRRVLSLPRVFEILTLMDGTKCKVAHDDISHRRFVIALQVLGAAIADAEGSEVQVGQGAMSNGHAIGPGQNGTKSDGMSEEALARRERSAAGRASREMLEILVKLLWKRCFIADNWMELNNTKYKVDGQVKQDFADTILYQTISLAFRDDIFTKYPYIAPPDPNDVIGTAATDDEMRRISFHEDAGLRAPFVHDNALDDDVLRTFCTRGRLGHWVQAAITLVREEAEMEKEVGGEAGIADGAVADGGLGAEHSNVTVEVKVKVEEEEERRIFS